METIEDKIHSYLSSGTYTPVDEDTLLTRLRIRKRDRDDFFAAIQSMLASGRIVIRRKGRISLRPDGGLIEGVVKKTSSGSGFVIPHKRLPELRDQDIAVDRSDMKDAQTGDVVLVKLISRRRSGGQRCGVIDSIVERASTTFVGTYFERNGKGLVRVDGNIFARPVPVGDPGAKGAQPEDKVVIDMLSFPCARTAGAAVLTKVLGPRGNPGVDTQTVIYSLGIPEEFSEAAMEEARQQADRFHPDEIGDRLDLRNETIVTIDPATARDFDDAISLRKDRRGHWQLGVHIADVAHFVPPGGVLDREARERGTSVYLPRHVIPMLPEVISNGLASLQEGETRFTKSVFIEFDKEGNPVGSEIANTVIKVSKRFAYEEVMPILADPASYKGKVAAKIIQLLQKMHELAMMLRRRRFARGALQMGIPEIEIDFSDEGQVTGAHERHHDESHEIIEEFMLAANIAAATTLTTRDIPFLRRVHGTPDELRLKAFQEFCSGLGYELKTYESRQAIQKVVDSAEGKPEQRAVNFALLRAMKQAEYSPDAAGHYALNEEDYCHFTSPIRRYPDLTLHRLLGELAAGKKPKAVSEEELFKLGKHCSRTERRAEKAERELIKVRLLRYLEDKVGTEMPAVITGVESFGLFCQGIELPAEGLVHISTLNDDFYSYDPKSRSLTGESNKRSFRLGDPITVVIIKVDVDGRSLDLRVKESSGRRASRSASAKNRTASSDRRSSDQSRRRKTSSRRNGNGNGRKKRSSRGR